MFDLRLLPFALGLWAGSGAVCLTAGLGNSRVFVVASAVVATSLFLVVATSILLKRVLQEDTAAIHFQIRSAVAVVSVGLVVGSLIGFVRVVPLHSEPFASMVQNGQTIEGQARLMEVPKSKPRADGIHDEQGAISWWVQAELIEVNAKAHSGEMPVRYSLSLPVSLRGIDNDPEEIARLVPGSVAEFSGRVQPGLPSHPQAASVMVAESLKVVEAAPIWRQWGAQVRESMITVAKSAGGAGGSLLPGLVVGDESQLDEQTLLAMRDTGLAHLTAVSGSNIAVVTGLVLAFCFALRLPRLISLGAAFVAMLGFVVVVGAQPSVLRATAMATIVLVTLAFKRDRDTVPTLLFSVAFLLVVDPWLSLSLGFALSVAATSGIILAGKFYAQSARDWRAKLKAAVIVTVAAQVATTPIIAGMGNGIPLIGVISNLLAMPAVPVATVLGLASAGFGLLHLGLGQWLAQLAALPAQWIATVALSTSHIPGGLIAWPGGLTSAIFTMLLVAALLLAFVFRHKWGHRLSLVVVALVLVAASFYAGDPLELEHRWLPKDWAVVVCDVGQGDASVIRTGDGRAIVIDVGGSDEPTNACLQELKITQIDLMILTHFHADHVGGLKGALARRQVAKVIGSPLADPPGQTGRVKKILADHGLGIEPARPRQSFVAGPVKVEILWPYELVTGQGSNPNNASVVSKVSMPGLDMLFPGDVEPAAQERMIERTPAAKVDVIKVPHHGSKNQSPKLPEWAGSEWAIMSAGAKNRYGHPHPKTIELFERAGARIVRTDTMGAIAIVPGPEPNILVKGTRE